MSRVTPGWMGWHPDFTDTRDFAPDHPEVQRLLRRLPSAPSSHFTDPPPCVDLRDDCLRIYEQGPLNSSPAFAVLSALAYFEAHARGHIPELSHLFLHKMTLKLASANRGTCVDLRTTLKALRRFGTPPERLWPYEQDRFGLIPFDPALFAFARDYEGLRYFRLDTPLANRDNTLARIKAFLEAGFATVFGFAVPSSVSRDGDIPNRPDVDLVCGGHAVLALGYDDNRRIGSEKGALLFQNSWGSQWGENGYGWLPYAFVLNRHASDFWTLISERWIDTIDFFRPQTESRGTGSTHI